MAPASMTTPGDSEASPRWSGRHTFAAFAVAHVLATVLGRMTVLPGETVGLAWPAAGVAVIWLLSTRHPTAVLAVLAGELAVILVATGASPVFSLVGPLAATLQTALVVALLRRWIPGILGAGGTDSIHSPQVLFRGTAAVAVGCLAGAVVGVAGLWLDGGAISWRDAVLWFGRQVSGVMIVGSLCHLAWERLQQSRPIWRPSAVSGELLLLWGASALVYGTVFFLRLPLTYLAIPMTVWCAVRFSTLAAAVHAATFGAMAVAMTLASRGPFSPLEDPAIAALLTQAFVLVAMMTGLVIGTVRDQRESLVERLVLSEATAAARAELLAAMTEAMTDGLVVVDAAGEVVRVNAAAQRLLARTSAHGMSHAADYQLLRSDGSVLPGDEYPSRRALVEGDVAPHDLIVVLEHGRQRVISARASLLPGGTESVDGPAALVVYRDVTLERAESHRLAEFAEVTAHDLRSPLTTVRGWVSLASHELAGAEPSVVEARELLVKALTGASRLEGLIDGMLDQALAEGAELRLEPLEMAGEDGLVADLGELLGVHDLVVQGPEGAIVLGDERSVRQLFANLLGNAVKYASHERPLAVTVDFELQATRVRVRVSDNGRGIAEQERQAVFERFNRAEALDSVAGTGIGLAICRVVVERHGGTISCCARDGGVGTTFAFDLPANLPQLSGRS